MTWPCPHCDGNRTVIEADPRYPFDPQYDRPVTCSECQGRGRELCSRCSHEADRECWTRETATAKVAHFERLCLGCFVRVRSDGELLLPATVDGALLAAL